MKERKSRIAIVLISFILLIFVTFSLLYFSVLAQNHTPTRPNIIFIMTDDQSPIPIDSDTCDQSRPFGFNGDKHVHTPIIDNLAKNGMIFSRAYVSSSVCSPSRYTTLTGRYAGRCEGSHFLRLHPVGTQTRVENNTELEEDRANLPRLLQEAGYKTGFVGKSHIIDHHLLSLKRWEENGLLTYDKDADPHLFEVSQAMSHNHNFWTKRISQFGFDYANGIYAANLKELYNDSLNVHNVEWKNKSALEFIEASANEPFFLYYSETIPHGPAPWLQSGEKYMYGLDANPNFTGKGVVDETYDYVPRREEIKQEVIRAEKDQDHAWLRWFDYAVGAIVDKLKEEGILENTLIILTSDHGNYNFGKATIYESGVRVPLMMYWPAGIKPGSHYNELVQNIDFTPTFLDLANKTISSEHELDGVSLKKVLFGDQQPVHDFLFFELGFARGVTTKDWKYITIRYDEKHTKLVADGTIFRGWNGHTYKLPYYVRNSHLGYHSALLNEHYFEKDQLYELRIDSAEEHNVIESNSDKVKEMKEMLVTVLKSFKNRPYGELVK